MMAGQLDFQKFSEELHWCIGQLELGLQRQSPDSRQATETVKLLKILRSHTAPMVKKRQVMRNAFGDYRKKMKDAEKKSLSGLRHSRFQPLGSSKAPISSRFLKMSHNKQNAGLVRDELNMNLSNLNLESSSEPGLPGSHISPRVSPSPAAGLDPQTPCGSGGLSVSSNGTVLGNMAVFGLTESSQVAGTEGIQNSSDGAANPSPSALPKGLLVANLHESVTSGLSPASSSSNGGVTSCHTNNASPTHVSASSDCRHRKATNQVSGFKYEPSDNSFVFGFESPGNGGNREMGDTESGISGSGTTHVTEPGCDKAASNVYKYQKSENDFCFNFTTPEDV